MKKVLAVILLISLLGGLFSGCKNKEVEGDGQQISNPPNSQEPITTNTQSPSLTASPDPSSEPAETPDYSNMPANFITPEELEPIVEGTGGGYDFTVPYDANKWFQVDDKNTFVMKFEHVDPAFPWSATTINNAFVIDTYRDSQYDYIVLKFMKSNTETVIVFEAINEDGIVGSSLGDAPEGIHFAVAIGR